jgi:hypothetical protein
VRLSDIVGHMGLAFWPQAALIIFLGVFAAVAWREWFRPSRDHDRASTLPLDED